MHIRCPHCQCALEIVSPEATAEITCPSCGTSLPDPLATATYDLAHLKKLDRFELLEHVGRGHFGDVWRARDTRLDRVVAVKVPRTRTLDPATARSFMREARAAAQLRHPNIVPVHEVDQADETLFIVSEFIQGTTLADAMRERAFDARETAQLCRKIALALEHAHVAGVVHRDLKPQNVMLDVQDEPHLMDFGLAKRPGAEMTITVAGEVLGTPAYMSPEQARGDGYRADHRSDIYSLGVMLYELLTGRRPFRGDSRLLLYQILSSDPPSPRRVARHVPRDLETICLKALQKDPARRYASAAELADDLQRFLDGRPIAARPISRTERLWRWTRRNPALAASGLLMLLTLAALILSLAAPRSGTGGSPGIAPPVLRNFQLAIEPARATVVFYPLEARSGLPRADQAVRYEVEERLETRLPPGDYLVVAVSKEQGYTFHEVYRRVPGPGEGLAEAMFRHRRWVQRGDLIELPSIEIPTEAVTNGMAHFEGAERFQMGADDRPEAPPHLRRVPEFFLDAREVTVADFRAVTKRLPTFAARRELNDDDPVTWVSYDEAVAYAEKIGKRLPYESEYEFAATLGGTRRFPWGDDPAFISQWRVGPAGTPDYDKLPTEPPVVGLYSNAAEWSASWFSLYPPHLQAGLPQTNAGGDERVVRGGPDVVIGTTPAPNPEQWSIGPRTRSARLRQTGHAGLGFRCARSVHPRLEPEDFIQIVGPAAKQLGGLGSQERKKKLAGPSLQARSQQRPIAWRRD